MPLLMATSTLW